MIDTPPEAAALDLERLEKLLAKSEAAEAAIRPERRDLFLARLDACNSYLNALYAAGPALIAGLRQMMRLEAELRQIADGRLRAAQQVEEAEPEHYYRKGYGRGLENAADRIAEVRVARQHAEPQGSRDPWSPELEACLACPYPEGEPEPVAREGDGGFGQLAQAVQRRAAIRRLKAAAQSLIEAVSQPYLKGVPVVPLDAAGSPLMCFRPQDVQCLIEALAARSAQPVATSPSADPFKAARALYVWDHSESAACRLWDAELVDIAPYLSKARAVIAALTTPAAGEQGGE